MASKKAVPVPFNKPSKVSKAEMKSRLDKAAAYNSQVPLHRFEDSEGGKMTRAEVKKKVRYVGVAGSRGVVLPTDSDPSMRSLRNPDYGIEKKAKRVTKKGK